MAKKLNPTEQRASSKVLDDLRQEMQGLMKGKIDGLKKVTVASDSKAGLAKGLSKAEELLGQHDGEDDADSVPGKMDYKQMMKEHAMGHEMDEEESPEEEMEESPEEESAEHEDMLSPEDIDAKIRELMALKAKKKGM